ncbi:hypothetical protein NL676_036571 [Syzygium grande]|nr:hypothetical protein NL676_036571 [Syzygium grande]
MGINDGRPYCVMGVISADGKKLNHKADLEFDRSVLSHEIGVIHRIKLRCPFHIFTCFEDGYEVVVRGCRAPTSVFLCPNQGMNKFDWFSRGFDFRELVDANTNKHGD